MKQITIFQHAERSAAPAARISGTREWSTASANCQSGCSHNCRYCYAKAREVRRFRRLTEDQWLHPTIRTRELARRWKNVGGTVMFPTTHDLLPEFVPDYLVYLRAMLGAGNRVLIVSKPHLDVISALCSDLVSFRSMILFRFTIGATDDAILKYWEPGAPAFAERLLSLQHAHAAGYATSISAEPMLDSPNIVALVEAVAPYVSDSIWIGKMNKVRQRVSIETREDRDRVECVEAGQTAERIQIIYASLRDHPLIRWKESIKEVLGLSLATEPGQDR